MNHALTHPEHAEDARRKAAALIELAIPSVIRKVAPPRGRLEDLKDYRRHAVYLGWLGLSIGAYRLIGGDNRWDAIQQRIADVLHQALDEAGGRPLWSFPTESWPFDTVPCLLALRLYDHARGWDRSSHATRRRSDYLGRLERSDAVVRIR